MRENKSGNKDFYRLRHIGSNDTPESGNACGHVSTKSALRLGLNDAEEILDRFAMKKARRLRLVL